MSKYGIVGPIFFHENVNSQLYVNLFNETFIPFVQGCGIDLDVSWSMQDGARPHTTNTVLDAINEHFQGRVLSLRYNQRFEVEFEFL